MGGSSESKNETKTETNQVDKRIAATDSARVTTVDGNNNTTTDYDAIQQAGLWGLEVIKQQGDIVKAALNQTQQVAGSLTTSTDNVLEFVDKQEKDDSLRLMPYLLAGVSVIAITGAIK